MRQTLAVAALTTLFASPAQAAPITVSAGDFVTFNFDLSGEMPPPPYVLASVLLNTSGLDFEPPPCSGPGGECALLDIGEWKFWTELDGTGSLFFVYDLSLGALFRPEMLDGVFSATLQVFEGSITVDDPVACGIAADGARTPGCPAAPPPPAPEPATVSLLAIGAAFALVRRRNGRAVRQT